MTTGRQANDQIWASQRQSMSKSGPSGATDRPTEREQKFDEEGGDQAQAPSERAVERELRDAHRGSAQEQTPMQDQWRDATSMGSEGRPHDAAGQQAAPVPYDEPHVEDERVNRRTFRHQTGR